MYTKTVKKTIKINGEDKVITGSIMFPAGTVVTEDDLILLPDSTINEITAAQTITNPFDVEICVLVYLGEASTRGAL